MTLGTDSGTSVATAGPPLRFHGRLAAAGRHIYSTRWSQSGVRAVHCEALYLVVRDRRGWHAARTLLSAVS